MRTCAQTPRLRNPGMAQPPTDDCHHRLCRHVPGAARGVRGDGHRHQRVGARRALRDFTISAWTAACAYSSANSCAPWDVLFRSAPRNGSSVAYACGNDGCAHCGAAATSAAQLREPRARWGAARWRTRYRRRNIMTLSSRLGGAMARAGPLATVAPPGEVPFAHAAWLDGARRSDAAAPPARPLACGQESSSHLPSAPVENAGASATAGSGTGTHPRTTLPTACPLASGRDR